MPVAVQGAVALRKALAKYAPDLKKQYDKEVREALRPIVTKAKANVPQAVFGGDNNWSNNTNGKFPVYNAAVIRRGLTYSVAGKRSMSGFVSLATLFNKSAVGAIAETAGRVHPGGRPEGQSKSRNPDAGGMMIERLNRSMGHLKSYKTGDNKTKGRLLYAAYAADQGKALDAVMVAVNKANRNLETLARQGTWRLAA